MREEWFAGYVCYAKEKGMIGGYPDGTFRPGDSVNFAEAAKMVSLAFGHEIAENNDEQWFKPYVDVLSNKKSIPVSITELDKKITRAEIAEIVWRLKTNVQIEKSLVFEENELVEKLDYCFYNKGYDYEKDEYAIKLRKHIGDKWKGVNENEECECVFNKQTQNSQNSCTRRFSCNDKNLAYISTDMVSGAFAEGELIFSEDEKEKGRFDIGIYSQPTFLCKDDSLVVYIEGGEGPTHVYEKIVFDDKKLNLNKCIFSGLFNQVLPLSTHYEGDLASYDYENLAYFPDPYGVPDYDRKKCDDLALEIQTINSKNDLAKTYMDLEETSFIYISEYYAKDNNKVFCLRPSKTNYQSIFVDADSSSFEILDAQGRFAKDKNTVFYGCNKIEDVDLDTFEFVKSDAARDKNNAYKFNGDGFVKVYENAGFCLDSQEERKNVGEKWTETIDNQNIEYECGISDHWGAEAGKFFKEKFFSCGDKVVNQYISNRDVEIGGSGFAKRKINIIQNNQQIGSTYLESHYVPQYHCVNDELYIYSFDDLNSSTIQKISILNNELTFTSCIHEKRWGKVLPLSKFYNGSLDDYKWDKELVFEEMSASDYENDICSDLQEEYDSIFKKDDEVILEGYKTVEVRTGKVSFAFDVPANWLVETRNSGEKEMTLEEKKEFLATSYRGDIKENKALTSDYADLPWSWIEGKSEEEIDKYFDKENPFPRATVSANDDICYFDASWEQVDFYLLEDYPFLHGFYEEVFEYKETGEKDGDWILKSALVDGIEVDIVQFPTDVDEEGNEVVHKGASGGRYYFVKIKDSDVILLITKQAKGDEEFEKDFERLIESFVFL